MKRRRYGSSSGTAGLEFAIIAPVLILAVLSTADIGFAIHETFEIDQTLRNGAQAALSDPGEGQVEAVLSTISNNNGEQSGTSWTVSRFCACPETITAQTSCSTTCNAQRPTSIFYEIEIRRTYEGIFLPARNLIRSASVQVR